IKLNVIQMGFASAYSLIALMIFSNTEKIQILKGMSLVSILYISIFATAVCFFLQTYCQKNTTSTRASILLATESLFAPIFAILLLNESLSIRTMIGAGLILFAVIVSETRLGFKLPEDENG
ncbi:MAG: DMT family transporter, partial [Leptotrichiaceae bacterium]